MILQYIVGLPVRLNMVILYCIMGRPPHANQFITIKSLAQPTGSMGEGICKLQAYCQHGFCTDDGSSNNIAA